jgi:hypothetical protein
MSPQAVVGRSLGDCLQSNFSSPILTKKETRPREGCDLYDLTESSLVPHFIDWEAEIQRSPFAIKAQSLGANPVSWLFATL